MALELRFEELERVETTSDVSFTDIDSCQEEDGLRTVPAGSRGTVVAVWDEGRAYEVEFTEPFQALGTIAAKHLRKAEA
jgi:hypothetical protein